MNARQRRTFGILFAFLALLSLACDLGSLVGASSKPTVVIVSPPSGIRVDAGAEIVIQSTATDAQGIARVELWVDGSLVANNPVSSPQTTYSIVQRWIATEPGVHVIQVLAYSSNGVASDPAVISTEVVSAVAQATQPPSAPRGTATPTSAQINGALTPASPIISASAPTVRPTTALTPPATKFAPADLPFYIDCSALDPSKKPACDLFIANTRDLIYPLLRELTGTSLSRCYDAVYYTIVRDEQLSEWMGQADKNRILYSQRATIDAAPAPLYDAHELLHTFAFCNGALDQHIFHGAIEGHVDLTLTGQHWQNPGRDLVANWLETKLLPDLRNIQEPGRRVEPCKRIFGDLVTILYYDSGIESIMRLYRATINPGPQYAPNETLYTLYGPRGNVYQVLVSGFEQGLRYSIDVPDCGYKSKK